MGSDDIYLGVCFALSASKISLPAAAKPQDNTEKAGEATKTENRRWKKKDKDIYPFLFLFSWVVSQVEKN